MLTDDGRWMATTTAADSAVKLFQKVVFMVLILNLVIYSIFMALAADFELRLLVNMVLAQPGG